MMDAATYLSTILNSNFYLLLFIISSIFLHFIQIRYQRHLRSIPGPFFASFSHLPRLLSVASGHRHFDEIHLHRKYGPVVRVGPNHVSFAVSDALPEVYSAQTKFEKSDFYVPFDAKTPHGWIPTVFSVRNERVHKGVKRPIAGAYSMTTLLELESLTDECIDIFCSKIDEKLARSQTGTAEMNLGDWLHWYAFDVILSITFSNRLDFMKREEDVDGIIAAIEGRLKYNSTIGQWPTLHKYLLGNTFVSRIANFIPAVAKLNTAAKIITFCTQQVNRYENKTETGYQDMLDRFKRTKANGEEQMTDMDVLLAASGNIFAGSDTTAISLRSMFYYLIRNPECMTKLIKEIEEKDHAGGLSEIVTFAESNGMPYLQACLKEAMRMHPAVGLLLERIVPKEGMTMDDYLIPAETIVGANPWVVARDRNVYGVDADEFRPDRWIEVWRQAELEGQIGESARTKLKKMERNFLAFGLGSRTCLGKHVSLLEMNKLVPQVLRKYTIELIEPEKEWTMEDYWFVKQLGLHCRFTKRQS